MIIFCEFCGPTFILSLEVFYLKLKLLSPPAEQVVYFIAIQRSKRLIFKYHRKLSAYVYSLIYSSCSGMRLWRTTCRPIFKYGLRSERSVSSGISASRKYFKKFLFGIILAVTIYRNGNWFILFFLLLYFLPILPQEFHRSF